MQRQKDEIEKWKKDLAESEKKIEQYKKVLMKGQAKIKDQQGMIDRLNQENNELKEKPAAATPVPKGKFLQSNFNVPFRPLGSRKFLAGPFALEWWSLSDESELRFKSLKSQFELTKTRLEKELADAKKENTELQKKVSRFGKLKRKECFRSD